MRMYKAAKRDVDDYRDVEICFGESFKSFSERN